MTIDDVKKSIADFYNGQTTLNEEEALRNFLETEEVPPSLEEDKHFILSLRKKRKTNVPEQLESRLVGLIDREAAKEKQRSASRKKRFLFWGSSIAAMLVVASGLSYFMDSLGSETPAQPKVPQEAVCQILQTALIEVSTELNNGIEEVEKSQKEIRKVNKEIQKEIK